MAIDRVDHAAAIPTLIAQEALGALSRYGSVATLVNRDYDGQLAAYGEAVTVFKRGTLAAVNKVADTDITFSDPGSPSTVTVTLNQHKVVPIKIEDVSKALARPDLLTGYGQDAAVVLAEAVDDALLALALDASVTTIVGSAGAALTKATMIDARTALNKARAPRGNRGMVLSSDATAQAIKDGLIFSGTTAGSNSTDQVDILSGDLRPAFGFLFQENQGVTVTVGTPNRINNMAFHRDAVVLATRPLAAPPVGAIQCEVIHANGFTIRVMSDYNIRSMAMEITLDILFGVKIIRPEHVVRVYA